MNLENQRTQSALFQGGLCPVYEAEVDEDQDPPWAVEYAKGCRKSYIPPPKPLNRNAIKHSITVLKEAQKIFRKTERHLSLKRLDGRLGPRENNRLIAVEDLAVAIRALESLTTPGKPLDQQLDCMFYNFAFRYRTRTGKPCYADIGRLVVKFLSDVLPHEVAEGRSKKELADWARKKVKRYERLLNNINEKTLDQLFKSDLIKSLRG